jgi:hypothetical protein
MASVTKAITGENQWSDSIEIKGGFDLSIDGTFVATVTVQRSFDGGTSWGDVDTFTSPTETYGVQPSFALYRVGVATGDYTSGTVDVALYEEDLGA